MLFNVALQPTGAYFLVAACGNAELPELCALADFPAAIGRRRGSKRILFDLLALDPNLTPIEHGQLGRHLAKTLVGFDRIAVVMADVEDMLAANYARSTGLPVRTFFTLSEAEEWLMSGA